MLVWNFSKVLLRLVISVISIAFSSQLVADDGSTPFAQLSSVHTQLPGTDRHFVSMRNVDAISGIGLQNNAFTRIEIKQSGSYFIVAAGQVGASDHAPSAVGHVDIWLVRNGAPIPNSGARQYIDHKKDTVVLVTQAVMPLNVGDSLSVGYSSTLPTLGLIAKNAHGDEPAIPSMMFSLFKIK